MNNESRHKAYKSSGGGSNMSSGGGSGGIITQAASDSYIQPAATTLVQATAPSLVQPLQQPGLPQRLVVRPHSGAAFLQSADLNTDLLSPSFTHSNNPSLTNSLLHSQNVSSHTHSHLTHTQNAPIHTHSNLTHTQNASTHTHSHLTHTQNAPTHTHSHLTHTQNASTYTHSNLTHTQNASTHTHNNGAQAQSGVSHTQGLDNPCLSHTHSNATYTLTNPSYTTNNLSHTHLASQVLVDSIPMTQSLPVTQSLLVTQSLSANQSQGMVQINPPSLTQSLVYAHPQVLTQSQVHTQSQIQPHLHTQLQAQGQSYMQAHTHTQSQSQIQVDSLMNPNGGLQLSPPSQTQLQLPTQLTPGNLQTQLANVTQASVLNTMPELIGNPQIDSSSSHQASKLSGSSLDMLSVPVSQQHSDLPELTDQAPPVSLNDVTSDHTTTTPADVPSTTSHPAHLLHTLGSFTLADQLSSSPGFTHNLTHAQILEALGVDRCIMTPRNNLVQAMAPQESPVELEGLPVLPLGDGIGGRPDQSSIPINVPSSMSVKVSFVSDTSTVSQLPASQINISSQQLTSSPLGNGLSLSQENLIKSLCVKPPTATPTTTSSLIASNRMLNKLLDTTKPHIPSQVTKAAEIAHLIPTVRPTPPRLSDREDSLDTVFTLSTRSTDPLTTQTRTSAPTVSSVATTLRTSGSLLTDLEAKANSSGSNDGIFGLPSNFQVNNATLVLPNSLSHGQIISQRDIEAQQVYSGSPTPPNLTEQLERLNTEVMKVLPSNLKNCHMTPATSSNVSGVNNPVGVSVLDKNIKKCSTASTSQNVSSKMCNALGLPEVLNNKSGHLLDSLARFQGNFCMKSSSGMISTCDPMFPSVMMTSGCSSPTSPGTAVVTWPTTSSQDMLGRNKTSASDTRTTNHHHHQTLADLLSRGTGTDILGGNGGGGIPLLSLSESRLPHTADVLLSEPHRSDESDLSLGASLSAASGEELHNNPNSLTADTSLVTGIGGDSAPLQGMPSPPLPSFSLPNITGDFMVSGVSGSKTCPSTQSHLPALLSNLATTADLDQFLESSNMCIDMSSLSESEVSLSAGAGTFAYSPEKSGASKKSTSSTSYDLTFTSALKAATTKCDNDEIKQLAIDIESRRLSDQMQVAMSEASRLLQIDVPKVYSIPFSSDNSQSLLGHSSSASHDVTSDSSKKPHSQTKPTAQGQSEKRKEILRKNELLVQQVACFKCRLCSFLSQDRSEIVNHMMERHSQHLSDSEESEEEVPLKPPAKRVKVLMPQSKSQTEESSVAQDNKWFTLARDTTAKHKPDHQDDVLPPESSKARHFVIKKEIEESTGKLGIFIKSEPKDVGLFEGRLINKDEEDEYLRLPLENNVSANHDSDQDMLDEDTNDSSTTNDSGSIRQTHRRLTRPLYTKTIPVTTTTRKKASKVGSQEDAVGIRCDVNGCGLKLKSESNIAYHRKCHVNAMLQCQECYSTKFQSWRDLALHLWRQHVIDMELHKCDICDYKSYSYSKLMNVHHKIHSDERPSLCDTCGKRFKTPKQLRNHKALHLKKTEAPQHQCEICQRPFSDKRMLRNHQESVHKKVKPYLCNYCGYSTASRSTLKMHMRQHTGEKPFACEKCKYRTSDHNSLRRHKMQHTGVRPYRCPYCDYASIQSTTFKVHLKDKHPGQAQQDGIMFTCGVCLFKTVKRDNYLAHVVEHSRNDSKRIRQTSTVIPIRKPRHQPETILSDLTPPTAPHVVNIDVESGTVTVETPQHTDFLNAVAIQGAIPGQVIMTDQYIYALDSSVLSQVRAAVAAVGNSEGGGGGGSMVQLADDVHLGIPLSLPLPIHQGSAATTSLQGLLYVATSTHGGQ